MSEVLEKTIAVIPKLIAGKLLANKPTGTGTFHQFVKTLGKITSQYVSSLSKSNKYFNFVHNLHMDFYLLLSPFLFLSALLHPQHTLAPEPISPEEGC